MSIKMKKYQSGLFIFTLAMLVSFGVQAVDITDTYLNGDTLTATKMDNIKNAVNSKQNRGSGSNVSGGAFLPAFVTTSTGWRRYDISGNYGYPTTDLSSYATAGVTLPDGAILTAVRCYFLDSNITYDLTSFSLSLYSSPINGFSASSIASASGTPTAGSSATTIVVADTTISHTVDNSLNKYWFVVRMDASTGYTASTSSSLRLGGCGVEYS